MSHRPHPTKNAGLSPDHNGPIWWQVEYWPEGKKRVNGKIVTPRITELFYGTENAVELFEADLTKTPAGIPLAIKNPRLKDIIPDFLDYYKTVVAASTVVDFMFAYRHLEPHFGPLRLPNINGTVQQQYKIKRLSQTYKGKPIAKRTVNRELSYLSSVIRWAEDPEGGAVLEPGTVKIKLYRKKQMQRIEPITPHTFEEVDTLIQAIGDTDAYKGKNTDVKRHQRMARDRYGLSLLMYDAGLRKKEARLIEGERVALVPTPIKKRGEKSIFYGTITVIRKGGKIQALPILTERLYLELKERLKETPTGYLYISPIIRKGETVGRPYVDIRDGLKAAGIRSGVKKKNNPHLFRHDFVTHLHASGADMKTIQELAGHSELSTTMDIYNHLTSVNLREHAAVFSGRTAVRSTTEVKKSKKQVSKGSTGSE